MRAFKNLNGQPALPTSHVALPNTTPHPLHITQSPGSPAVREVCDAKHQQLGHQLSREDGQDAN